MDAVNYCRNCGESYRDYGQQRGDDCFTCQGLKERNFKAYRKRWEDRLFVLKLNSGLLRKLG